MPVSGFTITVKGLDELEHKLEHADEHLKQELAKAMVVSTFKVKNDIQEKITNKGISNTGELRRSVTVIEASPYKGIVGVGEKYGAFVEFGTSPHFPPVDAIERWAQTKLGQPGLGFIIAKKIAREGTEAQPFVEPTYQEDKDFIQQQFEDVIQQVVTELGR